MSTLAAVIRVQVLSNLLLKTSQLSRPMRWSSYLHPFSRTVSTCPVLLSKGVKQNEDPKTVTAEEWKKRLTPEQYYITREKGTERPFSGKYVHNEETGTYSCACCGADLFSSQEKYDSGSGWPSYYDVIRTENTAGVHLTNVQTESDHSHGMVRTEVKCRQCDAHLGHVFTDGPKPTGMRYCINGASLSFKKNED